MPAPTHKKAEGDKNSFFCIWYRETKNERFCHLLLYDSGNKSIASAFLVPPVHGLKVVLNH